MPQDEKRGEVTGQAAGRKQEDSAIERTHPEEHPEIGLKGGRRDIEQMDDEDREIVDETTDVDG